MKRGTRLAIAAAAAAALVAGGIGVAAWQPWAPARDGAPASGELVDDNMRHTTPEEHAQEMARHYCGVYERLARMGSDPLDGEEVETAFGYLGADERYRSIKVLIAHGADAGLRARIAEEFGKERLAEWLSEDVASEEEGLVDFLARSYGEDYVDENAEAIRAVLDEGER